RVKTTVEIFEKEPMIYVDNDALGKMKTYIDECSDEIGWLGTVSKEDNNMYLIKDAYLFKQEVHAVTCEITTEGLTDFANEILVLDNGVDIWNDMKLWGHSHVNMSVSPSGQDNEQMKMFKNCGHDFFIRVIANKKGDMEFTLYDFDKSLIYKDVKWGIYYNDTEIWEIQNQISVLQAQLEKLKSPNIDVNYIKQEMKQKVTKKAYAATTNTWKKGATTYSTQKGWYDDIEYDRYGSKKNKVEKSEDETYLKTVAKNFVNACKREQYEIMDAYFTLDEIEEYADSTYVRIVQDIEDTYFEKITISDAMDVKKACGNYVVNSYYDIK
ncbi:MAG: hypothetical protein RR252_07860, partial [Longicatena sp.]